MVTALAEDPSGALWVGTEGAGLNRLAPATSGFQHFRHDAARSDSLADDTVYALHVDAGGALWVGTRSGLSRLATVDVASGRAVFETYTTSDGAGERRRLRHRVGQRVAPLAEQEPGPHPLRPALRRSSRSSP